MADSAAWMEQQKALWARAYDEVIAPDLEEQWKKRDRDHKHALKEKEENQQILFNHLNEEIQKTARLTKENELLKEQIRRQDGAAESLHSPAAANPDNSSLLQEELRQLTEKVSELTRKYQDVTQKAKYLERKNQIVMQKNKDMKESVRAWQEYADRQFGKQKPKTETRTGEHLSAAYHYHNEDLPQFPSSPGSVATVGTPATPANHWGSSPAPMALLPQTSARRSGPTMNLPRTPVSNLDTELHRRSNSVTPKPTNQPHSDRQNQSVDRALVPMPQNITDDGEHVHAHLQLANPGSSQTTVDEPAERTTPSTHDMEVEDEDNLPQFVSERSLKRKRSQPSKSRFKIHADRASDGTPARPYSVKEEPQSSPPVAASTLLLRKETFDLDEPVPSILRTPRHTQRHAESHLNTNGTLRHQRSNSAPFSQSIKEKHEDNEYDAEFGSYDLLTSRCATIELPLAAAEYRAHSEPSDSTHPGENVLRSLDPNIMSSVSEEPFSKRLRRSGGHGLAGHNILAESGEPSEYIDDQLRLPPRLARAQLNERLRTRKNQTTVKSSLQTPKSAPMKIKAEPISTPSMGSARSKHTPHTTGHKSRSKPRDDPTPGDRQIWTMKAPDSRAALRKACKIAPKQQGRLRDRPHTELTIQDFKPNPAYNQGYSYAFSETVRKRGDRMCLPGCTNLQCCGSSFRIFAEAQAPLPASQEEALLEDYLGEAYSNMQLTQMSSEERQELVLQARTKKMAKESGKHREAYERRRTPPGFWRVDFPTTQEQQEDREKAKEMETMEVQRRWLEAQRKGGKWVFRDE